MTSNGKKIRWVETLYENRFTLQFCLPDECYIDLVYVDRSRIINGGYGLFAARDLPKNIPFIIYLGRIVKTASPERQYIMSMCYNFVKKRNKTERWERRKKARGPILLDALTHDEYGKWTPDQEFHMGAHLMNDPDFSPETNHIKANCVVHKLMEVHTTRAIRKHEELFINYNC